MVVNAQADGSLQGSPDVRAVRRAAQAVRSVEHDPRSGERARMSISRSATRTVVPAMSAVAVVGAMIAGPAVANAATPVPPGGPRDVDGNGIVDPGERPDTPDL
jgi:hypothetical protein